MLSGVFGRTPATYMRLATCSRFGPTSALAPATPGIVWHVPQPYLPMAALPRRGLPPVIACALRSSSTCWHALTAANAHAKTHAATSFNTSDFRRLSRIAAYLSVCNAPASSRRRARRPPPPAGEEHEARGDVDQPRRNPHDESAELLVFERRQPPSLGRRLVSRIPDRRSEGDERAQSAAVDGRGEQVEHARAVAHPPPPPVDDCPPEEERRQEEAQVLCRVHPLVVNRRLKEHRRVPDPQGRRVNRPRRERVRHPSPELLKPRRARPRAERARPTER